MRVLVTGASGLIGSAVCDSLLARGDEVVGLARDPEKAKPKNPAMRWYAWDSTVERPPPEALGEVTAVINLIGEQINQRWTDAAKRRILDSRVVSTRNLIQGIASSGAAPQTFIGQSAVGFYGDRGAKMLDEESRPGDDFTARTCVAWEEAQGEAEKLGMRVVIVRTGLVLSVDGGLVKELLRPFKLGLGGPIAGGEQYMSWIQIEDEVGILIWALDNESVSGIVNATAPNPVTNREFSKTLGKAVGRPAVVPVPGLAVSALRGSELAQTVKGGARVMPRRAADLGYRFRYSELEPALEATLG
jgi:uncharacterized protein